jgi:4-amino-4-deoxy-L-arabinose transferase-like glycosyltransferase
MAAIPVMHRWMAPRVAVLAAAALLLLSLLTAWALPLFDPDEGYYPATAAESVDAGRPWDLQFNGQPRWDKPVLTYALIQSAFALLGRSDGAARVPSAIEGAALVIIVGVLMTILAGRSAGGLAALVLSTSAGVQIFSRAAHPEIALALSIGASQLLLVWWLTSPADERPRGLPLLIGVAMAYGVLAKGPVAIAVPAVGLALAAPFVLHGRARWMGALRDGLIAGAITVALSAPWYVAMARRHGAAFLEHTLWTQNVSRYTGQLTVHASMSPLYYVLPAIVTLLPWSVLLVVAALRVRRPAGADGREVVRFAIAMMAVGTFVFYSLSASKLASYILGLTPSAAALIGMYLDDERSADRAGRAVAYRATSVFLGVMALVLVAVSVAGGRIWSTRELTGGAPGSGAGAMLLSVALPPAIALVAGSVLVIVLGGRRRVIALAVVGAAVPFVTVLAARPLAAAAYPWQRFAARMTSEPAPIWLDTYRAPSMTFYAGRHVTRVPDEPSFAGIVQGAEGWLVAPQTRTAHGPLQTRIAAHHATIVDQAGTAVLVHLEPQDSDASP